MPRGENRDPRRWIRHFLDLRNWRIRFPTGSSDPSAPQIISPWISDIVQPVFPITPDFRVVPVPQPAAGAEFSLTVPDLTIFQLLTMRFQFQTDANAANRILEFLITSNAGQIVFHTECSTVQAANLVRFYCLANFASEADFALTNFRFAPIPENIWMRSGFVLSSNTVNRQVGDQFSALTAQVAAWPSV